MRERVGQDAKVREDLVKNGPGEGSRQSCRPETQRPNEPPPSPFSAEAFLTGKTGVGKNEGSSLISSFKYRTRVVCDHTLIGDPHTQRASAEQDVLYPFVAALPTWDHQRFCTDFR